MSEIFTCTSNALYNKHNYEVVLKNCKTVIFDNWEDAQGYWFVNSQIPDFLDCIIVHDKKKGKEKVKPRGFRV